MEELIFAQTQLSSDISSWSVCGLTYASTSVLSSPWNSLEDFLTGSASPLPPCMGNEKTDNHCAELGVLGRPPGEAEGARRRGGGAVMGRGLAAPP